jgi:hypothetical protein
VSIKIPVPLHLGWCARGEAATSNPRVSHQVDSAFRQSRPSAEIQKLEARATLAFKFLALMLSDHVHFVFFHHRNSSFPRPLENRDNATLENPIFNPKDALQLLSANKAQ